MAVVASVDAYALAVGKGTVTHAELDAVSDALDDLKTNLGSFVASTSAVVHEDGVNTDCNALTNNRHVVFSDGSNTTSPAPAGLYVIRQEHLGIEDGMESVSQLAWRYSTGLLYTRVRRLNVWSTWNKVG